MYLKGTIASYPEIRKNRLNEKYLFIKINHYNQKLGTTIKHRIHLHLPKEQLFSNLRLKHNTLVNLEGYFNFKETGEETLRTFFAKSIKIVQREEKILPNIIDFSEDES